MQTFSVEVVNVELWSIEWKQCAVIQASLFQFLSNILVYKNHHVYLLFCKVLLVIFETSSAILSMSKGPLVIRIVHGRTSYEVFLLTLPSPSVPLPPPSLSRTSWKFFFSHSVSWHANWLLWLLLAHFDHCAPGNCVK